MYEFKSVTELNNYTCNVLTNDFALSNFSVVGEISGFTINKSSGHAYFTVKDRSSQLSCIMFSTYLSRVNFNLEDGMLVKITGSASMYVPYGKYQMKVFTIQRNGQGDLIEQYNQLLNKLNKEGLFDKEHKKTIPILPKRIGVITSDTGEVIHDIITTLRRRNPHFDLVVYPVHVQGEECPTDVVDGVQFFNVSNNVDVIIIARGGGSIEDLFGFNDERIARAIYDSSIPIISAIGHESDYTICDYVADLRAPTPTAAAELVLAAYSDLSSKINNDRIYLDLSIKSILENSKKRVDYLRNHRALLSPEFHLKNQQNKLTRLSTSLILSANNTINKETTKINLLRNSMSQSTSGLILSSKTNLTSYIDKLDALGPMSVLKRGFAYISDGKQPITSVNTLRINDTINISLSDGNVEASVTNIHVEENNG